LPNAPSRLLSFATEYEFFDMNYVSTLIVIMACVLLSGCSQPRPIPAGTDTASYGYITEGEKFDVEIGSARLTARSQLEENVYYYSGEAFCQDSGISNNIDCRSNELFDFYLRDYKLGHKQVFVRIEKDDVAAIAWSSSVLYLDF